MYKIAIDTNIWFNLIENLDIDLLDNLWDNVNKQKVQVILPNCVEQEFRKKINSIRTKTIKNNPYTSKEDINSIIQSIYSLFNKSLKLNTIDKGSYEWVASGKAPNHNGNNFEDTLILNTLLSLPKNTEFYFVANDSDFRTNKNNYGLHPDIIEKFNQKELIINYQTNLPKVLFEIGSSKYVNNELKNYELYNWKAFKLQVKNKTIFEQLKEAIKYYYKELDFIPHSFLSNIYPFKSDNKGSTYFKGTTLVTNNELLFDFFDKSLKQRKNKRPEIKKTYFNSSKEVESYYEVLKKLNKNLIYNIRFNKSKISILLESEQEDICKCNICTFNRNEVNVLINQINDAENNSPKDLLTKAYYYFKTKNYFDSYSNLKKILDEFNPQEYSVLYFIALENMAILTRIWGVNDEKFNEVKTKIKPYNENSILKSGINSIIGYIKYHKFFDYKFFALTEDYNSVKNRFNTNNGLGVSRSYNIENENIIRWAELLYTSQYNGLFFEYYSNINRFAYITLKLNLYGSIDRIIPSKISSYILETTMPFISIKNYRELFIELKINILKIDNESSKTIFKLFLIKIDNFKKTIDNNLNQDYKNYHIEEIEKIAFLSAYINFSKKQHQIIISKLLETITLYEKTFKSYNIFNALIEKKGSEFGTLNAMKYINMSLKNKLSYDSNLNNIFLLLEDHRKVKLTQSQLEMLLNDNIQKETYYFRSYILYQLYVLGNIKEKKQILHEVNKAINKDENFDFSIYYKFTLKKIIPISDNHLEKFLNKVRLEFNTVDMRSNFEEYKERRSYGIDSLNYLINHLYLFYDNPNSYLKEFKGRSNYYDFLIDPYKFDISDIEVHWLYIAYYKSNNAIWNILKNSETIREHIANEILKLNNKKYLEAFTSLLGRTYSD